jgi:hypothetical protein
MFLGNKRQCSRDRVPRVQQILRKCQLHLVIATERLEQTC